MISEPVGGSPGWVVVVPAPGELKNTARALLALADQPSHVRTQRNGSEFRVPSYVADKYHESQRPKRRRSKKEGGT